MGLLGFLIEYGRLMVTEPKSRFGVGRSRANECEAEWSPTSSIQLML